MSAGEVAEVLVSLMCAACIRTAFGPPEPQTQEAAPPIYTQPPQPPPPPPAQETAQAVEDYALFHDVRHGAWQDHCDWAN